MFTAEDIPDGKHRKAYDEACRRHAEALEKYKEWQRIVDESQASLMAARRSKVELIGETSDQEKAVLSQPGSFEAVRKYHAWKAARDAAIKAEPLAEQRVRRAKLRLARCVREVNDAYRAIERVVQVARVEQQMAHDLREKVKADLQQEVVAVLSGDMSVSVAVHRQSRDRRRAAEILGDTAEGRELLEKAERARKAAISAKRREAQRIGVEVRRRNASARKSEIVRLREENQRLQEEIKRLAAEGRESAE